MSSFFQTRFSRYTHFWKSSKVMHSLIVNSSPTTKSQYKYRIGDIQGCAGSEACPGTTGGSDSFDGSSKLQQRSQSVRSFFKSRLPGSEPAEPPERRLPRKVIHVRLDPEGAASIRGPLRSWAQKRNL